MIRSNCRAAVAAAAIPFLLGSTSDPALASEGGGSQYPLGVETHFSGVMAPPGYHQFLYYSHYESSHSKDNNGDDNPRLAYFKIRTDSIATRASYVWPNITILGANVETRAAIALPTIELSLGIARPGPAGPLDRSGSKTGLADLSVHPVVLGWHLPTVHQMAGIELLFPTGAYDATAPVNIGRNYYGLGPSYSVTWLPRQGVDVSAKVRYGMSTTNKETNYRSGDELTFEFGGNFLVDRSIQIGATGYAYVQTTDDKQNGAIVNGNGNRGRVFALGPSMAYIFTPKVALIAKVQFEFEARNRSEGTRVWLQMKLPFAD